MSNARPTRTTAEWASLAASIALILVVVGAIVAQIPGDDRPASPTAHVVAVRQIDEAFHVDVSVDNRGDDTAANVQVSAELTVGDEVYTGDQAVDFLSGGEERSVSFVFDQDPASGDLRVAVTGYAVP